MTKQEIENLIMSLVFELIDYGSDHQADFPVGVIEKKVLKKEITIEEMVEHFRHHLKEGLGL